MARKKTIITSPVPKKKRPTIKHDERGNEIYKEIDGHYRIQTFNTRNHLTHVRIDAEVNTHVNRPDETIPIYIMERMWYEMQLDKKGNITLYNNNKNEWCKYKYKDNKLIEYKDHNGNWWSKEHFPNTKCPFHKIRHRTKEDKFFTNPSLRVL